MDRKRANKKTIRCSKKLIGYIKETLKERWQNHSSEVVPHWIRNLIEPNQTGGGGCGQAGEKIHTMGYNEIMVQVGRWNCQGGRGWTGLTLKFLEVDMDRKFMVPMYATLLLMVKNPKPCKWMGFQLPTSTGLNAGILTHQLYDCFESCGSLKWFFGNGQIQKPAVQASLVDPLVTQKKNTQVPSLKVTSNAPENRLFAPKRKRVLLFQLSIFRCKPFVSRSVDTEHNTMKHRNFGCVARPSWDRPHVMLPMLLQFHFFFHST